MCPDLRKGKFCQQLIEPINLNDLNTEYNMSTEKNYLNQNEEFNNYENLEFVTTSIKITTIPITTTKTTTTTTASTTTTKASTTTTTASATTTTASTTTTTASTTTTTASATTTTSSTSILTSNLLFKNAVNRKINLNTHTIISKIQPFTKSVNVNSTVLLKTKIFSKLNAQTKKLLNSKSKATASARSFYLSKNSTAQAYSSQSLNITSRGLVDYSYNAFENNEPCNFNNCKLGKCLINDTCECAYPAVGKFCDQIDECSVLNCINVSI